MFSIYKNLIEETITYTRSIQNPAKEPLEKNKNDRFIYCLFTHADNKPFYVGKTDFNCDIKKHKLSLLRNGSLGRRLEGRLIELREDEWEAYIFTGNMVTYNFAEDIEQLAIQLGIVFEFELRNAKIYKQKALMIILQILDKSLRQRLVSLLAKMDSNWLRLHGHKFSHCIKTLEHSFLIWDYSHNKSLGGPYVKSFPIFTLENLKV